MKLRSQPSKPARSPGTYDFESLSGEEKEALYQECERISAIDPGEPLTPAQRAAHAWARQRGRPRKGKGTRVISISLERDLLDAADKLARRQGVSRSELMSRGLRALLVAAGAA